MIQLHSNLDDYLWIDYNIPRADLLIVLNLTLIVTFSPNVPSCTPRVRITEPSLSATSYEVLLNPMVITVV